MPVPPFPKFRPGELSRADAEALNRLARAVEELARIEALAPLRVDPFGVRPRLSVDEEALNPRVLSVPLGYSGSYGVADDPIDAACAEIDATGGSILVIPEDGEPEDVRLVYRVNGYCVAFCPCDFSFDDQPGSGEPRTIAVPCCPGLLLPETLHVTLEDVSGTSCYDGFTFDILWNGVDRWIARVDCPAGCNPGPPNTLTVQFLPEFSEVDCYMPPPRGLTSDSGPVSENLVSCSPFQKEWVWNDNDVFPFGCDPADGPGGTVKVIVTE